LNQFYAMLDQKTDGKQAPPFPIKFEDAESWNKKKHGIFHTVNEFDGKGRRKENLTRISGWAIDIDTGDKAKMLAKLQERLIPSCVIETPRGLHVYWWAKNATPESWEAIVWDRLVPYYGGDANAKDYCRILRAPGFYHWKNPEKPFLVQVVFSHPEFYTVEEMLRCYPSVKQEINRAFKNIKLPPNSANFWDKIFALDCEEALPRLHEHSSLRHEVISFQDHRDGTKQICVNGKPTSCWIDRNKRIGSYQKGGPTVWQWLRWYRFSEKEIYQIIKERIPEVCQNWISDNLTRSKA